MSTTIWADAVLTAQGWAEAVTVNVDAAGAVADLRAGTSPPAHAERVDVLLPGIPNAHSHAHQRAMAGLGERRTGQGGFWAWREVMYRCLARIGPDELRVVARQLYLEMLKAGYTRVAEFQYLHHDPAGRPYAQRAELTLQCLQAAREVGIGFCAVPVLYRFGGFGGAEPGPAQRRFLNDADGFAAIVAAVRDAAGGDADATVGIAPHSLRAVDEPLLRAVLAAHGSGLVHLHIAEQQREVEDCLAAHGQRPVAWLLERFEVDARWCLVHATHVTPAERSAVAHSGATVVLCPTTEANLGDGIFPAAAYAAEGGRWAIGSDSHVSVSPVEELRWLEYGQRLVAQDRVLMGVHADGAAGADGTSPGRYLLEAAVAGGAAACGLAPAPWAAGAAAPAGIAVGAGADFVALEGGHPRLAGRAGDALLDSLVFSGNEPLVRDVWVRGRRVLRAGRHALEEEIARDYRAVLTALAQ